MTKSMTSYVSNRQRDMREGLEQSFCRWHIGPFLCIFSMQATKGCSKYQYTVTVSDLTVESLLQKTLLFIVAG